jgi:hypothetical protein
MQTNLTKTKSTQVLSQGRVRFDSKTVKFIKGFDLSSGREQSQQRRNS